MARRTASRTPSRAVFPRRLHVAGARRRDCLPKQSRRLCHPVPLRGRDTRHHRGRPQASRRPPRRDRRPPYLGPDPATPSPPPLCRAWWWTFARRHTLGRLPARLLPASTRPLPAIPPPVSARATSRLRGWPVWLLWRSRPSRRSPRVHPRLDQLRRTDWVVYAKPPFGGPEQVLAYLGRYTHRVAIANSRLISLADGKVS